MTDREVLELLNMFTTATQVAKSRNKVECNFEMDEVALAALLKKAFPSLENKANVNKIAKDILAIQ